MQAKKSKQLLKARLLRERKIYEMRKRAELKASISELEKPWELVEKAPVLFSIKADDQVKVLADRFQKPGGFDMWSPRDGPQILDSSTSRVAFSNSGRFFPKGVVHSVKPYGIENDDDDDSIMNYDDWISRGVGGVRKRGPKAGHARLNANKKEGCIDVKGTVTDVMDDNQRNTGNSGKRASRNMINRNRENSGLGLNSKKLRESNGHSGQDNSYSSDSDVILKNKYKNKGRKVALRPTSDLHDTEGRKSYNWKDD